MVGLAPTDAPCAGLRSQVHDGDTFDRVFGKVNFDGRLHLRLMDLFHHVSQAGDGELHVSRGNYVQKIVILVDHIGTEDGGLRFIVLFQDEGVAIILPWFSRVVKPWCIEFCKQKT